MKIVVTGGTGMVGSYIKDIVRVKYPEHEFKFLSRLDCELTDRKKTLLYFKTYKFDYIIHLAAAVGGLYKNMNDKIFMFSENIKINENILKLAIKRMLNVVYFVCHRAYIYENLRFPMTEEMLHESPPHFSNEGYSYSKRMLEMQTRAYNKKHGCQFICATPVNLYGKYDNFNLVDGHFIPMIMHRFFKETIPS